MRFKLPELGSHVTGFAVRFGGKVYAYLNRCAHISLELDWNPGEFFDLSGQYLICATHGAHFQPDTGYCVAGPCHGQMLESVQVKEQEQQIFINLESLTNV
ncbi:Rieske 2Fe-2S domain-containing protein [Methylobacillus arboreus]|uniref:Rieske (2Fe-2S) protein n=1 Tax=Methylobacillus arboreus TaxID=755170 RepID=UPI001E567745|nr:Rieske 2Fe-2S domain-containing protein [Methylobacillus arboreus]MCB5189910.1 Rieske 2Fe-2S domain-containing protein [Methylobacillus arboreus]